MQCTTKFKVATTTKKTKGNVKNLQNFQGKQNITNLQYKKSGDTVVSTRKLSRS